MSLDTLGEWLNMGSITPQLGKWVATGINADTPSNLIKIKFFNWKPNTDYSRLRVRGIYLLATDTYASQSIVVYPSSDNKIVELPIPNELLQKTGWSLAVEVKKYFPRNQLGVAKSGLWNITVDNWKPPINYYQQGAITSPIPAVLDNYDYYDPVKAKLP